MARSKIKKQNTEPDFTPFVDVAFLILCFFILVTKMKAPEAVPTTPPSSVSSDKIPENETVLITFSPENEVFFSIRSKDDPTVAPKLIQDINARRNLGLNDQQMAAFANTEFIGTPLNQLGQFLSLPDNQRGEIKQTGIPVTDSLNNELQWWIMAARSAFADGVRKVNFLIKGDENAKFETFQGVIDALRKNDEQKYYLITAQEQAPQGTDLYNTRMRGK